MTAARELLAASVVAAVLGIFARTFLVQAFIIPSDSMAPGLLAGDHVLVNKFIYGGGAPASRGLGALLPMRGVRRGDVVVFRSPLEPRQHLIKRCVGLPGETLALDRGQLHIDGRRLDESGYRHSAGRPSRAAPAGSFGPVTIPEDRYFFLGDHRARSRDSRAWGPISPRFLTGRAVIIYWSVRPGGVAESPDLWDKMAFRAMAQWLERCRWRRIFELIR